jgi:hypothetical protein
MIAHPLNWAAADRGRLQRLIRNMGYKMTRDERSALLRLVEEKTEGHMFPFRIDRGYRRIFGYGCSKPRRITVSYGADADWSIMEQQGRCWLAHQGLRVE